MGFQSFLKGFLWLNNMILLMLGASVALYAAVLLAIFERERRKSGGDAAPAAPPPPPLAPGSDAPSYVYHVVCLLYTSPSPRDGLLSRMPSSA